MLTKTLLPLLAISGAVSAVKTKTFGKNLVRRADFPIPESQGSVTFDAAEEVDGEYDGGYKTYGRGVSCTGQEEGGDSDAVFILKDGASLKNAIIGSDQIEGVHCEGSCTLENVWWEAVCEDALSFKGDGDATVTGGGATGAEDKVLQQNGIGSITVDGFTVVDFGKLYRSCGNCDEMGQRTVRQCYRSFCRAESADMAVRLRSPSRTSRPTPARSLSASTPTTVTLPPSPTLARPTSLTFARST
ncbi:Pectate lyase catalytic [Macrophomina phaseolina MS6]|uniref:Pectate lyase n=1 Tax=Macrophomina phaseolina (strain MS6) TaxID=1126212 RepID=K2S8F2_MACPH|nr:Pectate lyase catalytic [Macrophomina phaseolina MS6]